jgi:hypothetical protein
LINGLSLTVTAPAGTQVTVTISGFLPFEPVQLTLHSDTVDLGTFNADAVGAVSATVTIPAGIDLGAHVLSATGLTSGRTGTASLTVVAPNSGASPTPSPSPSGPAGGPLARTGGPVGALALAGLLLVVLGAGYVGLARRRRRG